MKNRVKARSAILLALALSGCSMTTQYWIRHSLKRAGFDQGEARCATQGIMTHLSGEQLYSIRNALLIGERPPRFADADALLAFLQPRVSSEVQSVLAHYAAHCRRRD
jgi:hypothetical protein